MKIEHVNYTHLIGEVADISFMERSGKSPFCRCKLHVVTEYNGKVHPMVPLDLIFWDRLALAIKGAKVQSGDVLNVEGRNTVREVKGKIFYSVTGNKVKVLRQIKGKEPFWLDISKDSEE